MNGVVNFDSIESLVTRCTSLKSLKLNKNVTLEQLQHLTVNSPGLTKMGTGSYSQEMRSQ